MCENILYYFFEHIVNKIKRIYSHVICSWYLNFLNYTALKKNIFACVILYDEVVFACAIPRTSKLFFRCASMLTCDHPCLRARAAWVWHNSLRINDKYSQGNITVM